MNDSPYHCVRVWLILVMHATCHNHSTFSDGKATIGELVSAAQRLGVDVLGISDHFTMHPSGRTPSWSMPMDFLEKYVSEIRSYQYRSSLTIRAGLEVDWFESKKQDIEHAISSVELDYVIGSVHYIHEFCVDASARKWSALSAEQQNAAHREYWIQIHRMAESGLFDIVAHLDLTKKFGFTPTIDLNHEITTALDAIAAAGMVVELNTAGWHKSCADAYPTLELLNQCRKRDIPTMLAADAHDADHLLRDFDRGAQRLREAGYTQVARFTNRQLSLNALAGDC